MFHQLLSLKGMKRLTLYAIFFTFISFPFQGDAQNLLFEQRPANFTDVAKKSIPAVVSIKVKMKQRDRGLSERDRDSDDPFDYFQDELFRQFFGRSRRERGQPPPERRHIGQASGFIVRNDGYILTNGHVVKDAEEIEIILNDGREFEGELIGSDPHTDIAVVKIPAENLPYIPLGNSDDLEVGQWVIAIGTPLGLRATVTAGVVSAKGRNNLELARIEDFIQTDAAINRGNSGGPLLTLDGSAVGMNTAIVTEWESGGSMGIGFAIPSNLAKHIMEQLITTGSVTRGFMGVTLQKITQDLAQAFHLERVEGALIDDVRPGSPADEAGIQQGDVILAYDRRTVTDIAALRNAISMMKPGTQVNLAIFRNGRTLTIPFTVGSYPEDEDQGEKNQLGVRVKALTPEIAKLIGYEEETQGVVVTSVEPGSSAEWAGIKKGILIVAVNRKPVASSAEFYRFLNEAEQGEPILLLVKLGDTMHFVSIKVK